MKKLTENQLWMRVFGAGFILMVLSFCFSILLTPITLRGGVYNRLNEYNVQTTKTLEYNRMRCVAETHKKIDVLYTMLRGMEEMLLKNE